MSLRSRLRPRRSAGRSTAPTAATDPAPPSASDPPESPVVPARRASPAVPVVLLVVVAVVLAVTPLLLREHSAAVGLAAIPDTGPVVAGVDLPADGGAGPPEVRLTRAAAAHPRANEIRALVQRSVDARNGGDFAQWSATLSGRGDQDEFTRATRSQRIGSVVLRRVDPVGGGEIVVPTGLITTQRPEDAPPDIRVPRLCWQVSMVVLPGPPARLVDPRPGSALRTPC